jgi:hypothetical protein
MSNLHMVIGHGGQLYHLMRVSSAQGEWEGVHNIDTSAITSHGLQLGNDHFRLADLSCGYDPDNDVLHVVVVAEFRAVLSVTSDGINLGPPVQSVWHTTFDKGVAQPFQDVGDVVTSIYHLPGWPAFGLSTVPTLVATAA